MIETDEIDRRIIELLQQDGRMSIQEIAGQVSITSSAVRKRIQRLEDANVMRIVAVTDFNAAGFDLLLAIAIEVENRPSEEVANELAEEVCANPPLSVRATVRTRRWYMDQLAREIMMQTAPHKLYLSEDFREAALAFTEKRKPKPFKGR